MKEKTKKEVVDAKQQKEAELQENIRILSERLHCVFGDTPHTYTACNFTQRLEEGVGDNFTHEQVGDNVVPLVKYHGPDDIDFYS